MSQNDETGILSIIKIWNLFRSRFKSSCNRSFLLVGYYGSSAALPAKQFDAAGRKDVERYYRMMGKKVEEGKISPLTLTKKFRELHSFSKFLLEEWSDRLEDESKTSSFKDYFEPYLKQLVKEKELARMILWSI